MEEGLKKHSGTEKRAKSNLKRGDDDERLEYAGAEPGRESPLRGDLPGRRVLERGLQHGVGAEYLSVRWVAKGVSPFQSARTPSARATVAPQCAMPRYAPARSSCSCVLTTSMGCRQHASMTPPRDPAAAFTYGGTGGRPPAPRKSSAGEDAPGDGGSGEDDEGEGEAIREPAAALAGCGGGEESGSGGSSLTSTATRPRRTRKVAPVM
jgi:hypothetical protein